MHEANKAVFFISMQKSCRLFCDFTVYRLAQISGWQTSPIIFHKQCEKVQRIASSSKSHFKNDIYFLYIFLDYLEIQIYLQQTIIIFLSFLQQPLYSQHVLFLLSCLFLLKTYFHCFYQCVGICVCTRNMHVHTYTYIHIQVPLEDPRGMRFPGTGAITML